MNEKNILWLKWENGSEWGEIECPMLDECPMLEGKMVMTYFIEGQPCYDTYTAPFVIDGDICCYRYDHDCDCWDESVYYLGEYKEGIVCKLG